MWGAILSIGSVIAVLASIATTVHILLRYKRSTTAVAWLFAVWVFPLLGSLAYLTLAVYEGPRSIRNRRRRGAGLRRRTRFEQDGSAGHHLGSLLFRDLHQQPGIFPLRVENQFAILPDSATALAEMLQAIAEARDEILVQTFILQSGTVMERISAGLSERARAGVSVRMLIDPIGTVPIPTQIIDGLREAGVRTEAFLSPNPLKGRFQINFRNHRKLLLVDRDVAFIGGRNLSDDYFDTPGSRGFRDVTVQVRGPLLADLRRVFLEDWALATDCELEDTDAPAARRELQPEDCGVQHGRACARVFAIGPDESGVNFVDVLGATLSLAERSIFIVSPYFAPGPEFLHRLRVAALRGVQVTLLLPRRSDLRLADLAARHFCRQLTAVGVEVRFRTERFIHAKAMIVDGSWTAFGSVNFDQRSFHLNYELNVEVYGEDFATRLRGYFETDMQASVRLDPDQPVPWWRCMAERAAALFEPLL